MKVWCRSKHLMRKFWWTGYDIWGCAIPMNAIPIARFVIWCPLRFWCCFHRPSICNNVHYTLLITGLDNIFGVMNSVECTSHSCTVHSLFCIAPDAARLLTHSWGLVGWEPSGYGTDTKYKTLINSMHLFKILNHQQQFFLTWLELEIYWCELSYNGSGTQ